MSRVLHNFPGGVSAIFSPLTAVLLVALFAAGRPVWAQDASREAQFTAEQLLEDYKRALGPAERIRSFLRESTMTQGSAQKAEVRTRWSRDGGWKREYPPTPSGQRVEYFDDGRAFLLAGRHRTRFRPGQLTTRPYYYAMRALANPFALLAYANDDRAKAGLVVGRAPNYHVLATRPDEYGVRTLYLLDAKTGRLIGIRFEEEPNKPFASIQFEKVTALDGVLVPYGVHIDLRLPVMNERRRVYEDLRIEMHESVTRWHLNKKSNVSLRLPKTSDLVPKGWERAVIRSIDEPTALAIADMDSDGEPDIVVAGDGGIVVHFGGALEKPLFVSLGKTRHRGCRVADFDLDGHPDVLVMSWNQPAEMCFVVSFPDGRKPRIRQVYAAPNGGHDLVIDDFDRDGIPDFVATGEAGRNVVWKFGNGSGGVRSVGTGWELLKDGEDPMRGFGVAVGDVIGDGMRDIAVAEPGRPRVVLFRGRANLSFHPHIVFDDKNAGLVRPVDVEFADLNGDGYDDLLVAQDHPLREVGGDIGVFLNTGKGAFRVPIYFAAGERVMSVRAVDVNGDGHLDVVAPSHLTDQLALLSGDGTGKLAKARFFNVGRGPVAVETGDVDGNGTVDLVVASGLDDSITILRNVAGKQAIVAPARKKTTVVPVFRPVPEKPEDGTLTLTEKYEFAGEWRLPADIRDPSGIAFLHHDPVVTGLVVVSDKTNAIYRVTHDLVRDRILVAPAIGLVGAPKERFDLEGVAFDRQGGTLFLGCEIDNTILRATLFGHMLGRAKTGIAVSNGDGIEGVALRRKRDGTPLLYVFKERFGRTGVQPPLWCFDMVDSPFSLKQRGDLQRLPLPMVDQTGAVADGSRLFVVSRFARSIAEMQFDGDRIAKKYKVAGFARIVQKLLGYPGFPAFGMVEGIARASNGDLYLIVDSNGATFGIEGKNRGSEGRLIRLRCVTPMAEQRDVDRVTVKLIFVPFAGAKGAPSTRVTRERAAEIASTSRTEVMKGADFAILQRKYHFPDGVLPSEIRAVRLPARPAVGEFDNRKVPKALFRLVFQLAVGEVAVCEYDAVENPWGYYVAQRIE